MVMSTKRKERAREREELKLKSTRERRGNWKTERWNKRTNKQTREKDEHGKLQDVATRWNQMVCFMKLAEVRLFSRLKGLHLYVCSSADYDCAIWKFQNYQPCITHSLHTKQYKCILARLLAPLRSFLSATWGKNIAKKINFFNSTNNKRAADMGVHKLWEILSPAGRRVALETLANKRLAIGMRLHSPN